MQVTVFLALSDLSPVDLGAINLALFALIINWINVERTVL